MRARWCLAFLLSVFCVFQAEAQLSETPVFEQKALLAFSPAGVLPLSLTLSGSATWTAGSLHESGTLQIWIAADGSTSETWAFQTVSHSYVQPALDAGRSCQSTDASGKVQTDLSTSCQQPIPWFAPWYALQAISAGGIGAKDGTNTADASANLEKLTYTMAFPALPTLKVKAAAELARFQQATAVTVFYDAQTALPSRLEYKQSTNGDDSHALDISVHFSDYRAESGFMMPHHIKRFVQGTLQLDYLVTSVAAK